jgi:hypothetical protein
MAGRRDVEVPFALRRILATKDTDASFVANKQRRFFGGKMRLDPGIKCD